MTNFSLRRPWVVILLVLAATVLFAAQMPKVHFDNDPENMLSADEPVRLFHHQVKEKFALYDFVIVGIVNEEHPDGIFNVETLGRVHRLTGQLLGLRRGADDLPAVPSEEGGEIPIDLRPTSIWKKALAAAFRHDANELFDEEGRSVIIGRELIAPSVVDNIKQAEVGSLKLEYLMENPPATREEALAIGEDAMGNRLYSGTLVSEDGKALCLYIPIPEKRYSYNVAALVRSLTAEWPDSDSVLITGLPVAEDTFGVEMLVQMATSAPLAGLAIFLLLLFFFRRVSLIAAPMIVAMVSVVCTMGLLIGLGYDVHIMSSMIAIFLMPIAVADAVHILSEFYDSYHRFGDKARTVRYVIGHLFRPMLYTSLTTIAGFASLGTTPIPPVQVFGLHVAFGVAVAWLLSMTLIPAYIMVAVPEEKLSSLAAGGSKGEDFLSRALGSFGDFGYNRWKLILAVTFLVVVVSGVGIGRIEVNDNPVKWFTESHEIRVADRILNRHFGGTYTAYLTLSGEEESRGELSQLSLPAKERFGATFPEATDRFLKAIGKLDGTEGGRGWRSLAAEAEVLDRMTAGSWLRLADVVVYLDPEGIDLGSLASALEEVDAPRADKELLLARLEEKAAEGEALVDAALAVCDEFTSLSFADWVASMEAELSAPLFKRPELLRYLEGLQRHLEGGEVVGKTSSAVDALKKAAYELTYSAPGPGADALEVSRLEAINDSRLAVPDTAAAAGQVFVQLEGMKKKDSLFHLVTRDYEEANLWVQLKSGDNRDMEKVILDVERYLAQFPPPVPIEAEWAGLTYLNVVWQDKMVRGMLGSLAGSFVVVLAMMIILFRSPLYGLLAMIPLSVTIAFIYGLIGLVGKDYDMPVAVLSALTLGLSVDFAIHFLQRAREMTKETGNWREASRRMFKEPAAAISRNAITISIGFTPLLVAPLVPYKTVGLFLATIMAVSWLATLFILPALLTMLKGIAFGRAKEAVPGTEPKTSGESISRA